MSEQYLMQGDRPMTNQQRAEKYGQICPECNGSTWQFYLIFVNGSQEQGWECFTCGTKYPEIAVKDNEKKTI